MSKGKLRIIDNTGHTEVAYDTDVEETVKEAERITKEALAGGANAYATAPGKVGEKITEFDPSLSEITIAAPIVGG